MTTSFQPAASVWDDAAEAGAGNSEEQLLREAAAARGGDIPLRVWLPLRHSHLFIARCV